jgi:exosortase family protein XrtM
MRILVSPTGVPYVAGPDELSVESRKPRSFLFQSIVFIVVFALLQTAYGMARDTWIQHLVIDSLTVRPATALINLITPDIHAVASGSLIRAAGGGINVLNGCEGSDALFLLVAAFTAYPMSWKRRGLGLLIGILLVFALNQLRLLALFYSYRADRALFDSLHGTVAPIVLIVSTALFFLFWLSKSDVVSRAG